MYNQLYIRCFVMESYSSYHRKQIIYLISKKKRVTNGIDLLVEKLKFNLRYLFTLIVENDKRKKMLKINYPRYQHQDFSNGLFGRENFISTSKGAPLRPPRPFTLLTFPPLTPRKSKVNLSEPPMLRLFPK